MYKILISKSAEKELDYFTENILVRVLKSIRKLEINPRPAGCKKLKGNDETLYRIRTGDYRIIYSIDDKILIVDIRKVGHRRDVYL